MLSYSKFLKLWFLKLKSLKLNHTTNCTKLELCKALNFNKFDFYIRQVTMKSKTYKCLLAVKGFVSTAL